MAFLNTRDGRKLYYEESGTGRPIVLIHGWKASARLWDYTVHALESTGMWRCVRYDHCGHMRSEIPAEMPALKTLADDLHDVITGLGLEKPILVGHSMGGATILEYIRHYGCEGLDRIVIVDMAPMVLSEDGWKFGRRGNTFTRQDADANVVKMKENFREYLRDFYCGGNPGFAEKTAAEQDAIIEERMQGHNCEVLTSLMKALYDRDHRDVLPKITCPTGIFHAEVLPVCSAEVAVYYKEHIPTDTTIVCFEGGSHALISEQPDRFLSELTDFLAM